MSQVGSGNGLVWCIAVNPTTGVLYGESGGLDTTTLYTINKTTGALNEVGIGNGNGAAPISSIAFYSLTARWGVAQGDWSQSAFWSNALPTSLGDAHVTNGGAVRITLPVPLAQFLSGRSEQREQRHDPNVRRQPVGEQRRSIWGNNGTGRVYRIRWNPQYRQLSLSRLQRWQQRYVQPQREAASLSAAQKRVRGLFRHGDLHAVRADQQQSSEGSLTLGGHGRSGTRITLGGGGCRRTEEPWPAQGLAAGWYGTGTFTQCGGTNSIGNELYPRQLRR